MAELPSHSFQKIFWPDLWFTKELFNHKFYKAKNLYFVKLINCIVQSAIYHKHLIWTRCERYQLVLMNPKHYIHIKLVRLMLNSNDYFSIVINSISIGTTLGSLYSSIVKGYCVFDTTVVGQWWILN